MGTEKARREVRGRACRLSDFSGVKLSVATEQRNPYFPFVTQDDYPSADIFRRVADHAGIRVVARPPAYSVSLSARHDLAERLSSRIPKKNKLRLIEVFAGLERASSDTLAHASQRKLLKK